MQIEKCQKDKCFSIPGPQIRIRTFSLFCADMGKGRGCVILGFIKSLWCHSCMQTYLFVKGKNFLNFWIPIQLWFTPKLSKGQPCLKKRYEHQGYTWQKFLPVTPSSLKRSSSYLYSIYPYFRYYCISSLICGMKLVWLSQNMRILSLELHNHKVDNYLSGILKNNSMQAGSYKAHPPFYIYAHLVQ